jgi:beta-lactamase regulating signal transducer with metallopeptidase domain
MRSAFDAIAYWLIDFYMAAAAVLIVVTVAQRAISQPSRRLALHWGTLSGLALLVVLCVLPGWPRIDVVGVARAISPIVSQPALEVSTPIDHRNRPDAPAPADSSVASRSLQLTPKSTVQPDQSSAECPVSVSPNDAASVQQAAPLPSGLVGFWRWLSNLDLGPMRLFALAVFAVGCALTTFRITHGVFAAHRVRRSALKAPRSVVSELEKLVGNRHCPELLVSRSHPVPIVIGTLNPKILLPPQFAERERPDDCRSVLAHELAHIHNGDLWLLALDRWLLPLFWMHPLYLRMRRSLRDDQELLADSFAASHSSRADYADMLVRWARRLAAEKQSRLLAAAVGVWERPTRLHNRISRLLHPSQRLELRCSRVWRMGSLLALIALPTLLSTATVCPQAPSLSDIVASWRAQPEASASCCHGSCSAKPAAGDTPYLREQPAIAQVRRLGGSIKSEKVGGQSFVTEVNMLFHETQCGRRVENKKFAPEVLPHIAKFGHLKVLVLAGRQVTNCGLWKISRLNELESLTLRDARLLTGAGVAELGKLPRLRRLEITNAGFTNAEFQRLGAMRTLEELSVEGSNLTQEAVAVAAGMPNLRSLSVGLPNTLIGREVLSSLHSVPKLERLALRCSEIPDDALMVLRSLTSLRSLSLGDSRVSPRALADLRRSLPDLAVQTVRQTARAHSPVSSEQTNDRPLSSNEVLAQSGKVAGVIGTSAPSTVRLIVVGLADVQLRLFAPRIHPSLANVEWTLSFVNSNLTVAMSREFSIHIDRTLVFKCRLCRVGNDWKIEQCQATLLRDGPELASSSPKGPGSEQSAGASPERTID